ncbi:Cystathionine beta-lyase PatB [Propionispora sp. 2/2-37]|uniref:MalY/PatB family protein n=1 Tax=Propionispora sp. 2/2-37 TaxID=1677858 RepID=UPI0006BB56AF|nr:pyridoxal phosphate-dependent aminotransferase [Propionispora sp. 2/2-37]CUH97594.1 Cystathionine beta-lyase PatB [Propionispora sp. 2/2-37]
MQHLFDEVIDRRRTGCRKWDAAGQLFGTDDVLPMWIADMDFKSPPAVVKAIQDRAGHGVYGYPHKGEAFYTAIQSWMRRRHDWQVEKEWILGTPGVVPALSTAILAYTRPGDKIIIQPPVYPPFFSCVINNQRELVQNPLVFSEGRYCMDFDDLENKLDGKVKMLILCSPHNPVGRVWSREELERLGKICEEHDLIIVSDEIHADLVFSGHQHIPMASLSPEVAKRTITCMAASKTFNVAGLYTAIVIISDPQLRDKFMQVFEALDLNTGNLFGITALVAAYEQGESWLEELLLYLNANIDYMLDFVMQQVPEIQIARPEATYLAWLDCRGLGLEEDKLKSFFIQQAKVGLNDGRTFGGKGYMRLNFGCPRNVLEEGLLRIARAVKYCR